MWEFQFISFITQTEHGASSYRSCRFHVSILFAVLCLCHYCLEYTYIFWYYAKIFLFI